MFGLHFGKVCEQNASKMRAKCEQNASKMRAKCEQNASKMRAKCEQNVSCIFLAFWIPTCWYHKREEKH